MKYNTEKHKPMMVPTETKDNLDTIRKELIVENLVNGGTGRISYGDVIDHLIRKYEEKK